MEPSPVVFRTKVDGWLVAVLAVAAVGVLGAAAAAFLADPATGWLLLASMGGAVLLVAVLSVPTEYAVTGEAVVSRYGVLRKRIPLADIERVYPTWNPLSAPAWSLDRLGVRYRTGGRWHGLALISPVRQEAFLSLLAERAGLRADGTGLTRGAPPA